jgi:hypothetical protein
VLLRLPLLIVLLLLSTTLILAHCHRPSLCAAPLVLILTVVIALAWYYISKAAGRPFKGPHFDLEAFEANLLQGSRAAAAEGGLADIKATAA